MPAKLQYTDDGLAYWQADPTDTVDNVNPIQQQQPLPIDTALAGNPFTAGIQAFKNLTTDKNGERYQTWPERLARSAITLPVDVMQGNVLSGPGLRREDYTDMPIATEPTKDSTWLGQKLGLAPISAQPLDPMMERAQDMAGLAGGSTLAVKPGTASVGSGLIRPIENEGMTLMVNEPKLIPVDHDPFAGGKLLSDTATPGAPLAALENAPAFYSAVENAVKNAKQNVATADQWLGYLKNQPGVKQEELDWTLGSLPQGKITKAELEQHVADHKVELKEVNKGRSNIITRPNENEPHILEVYRADDPEGLHSGMVGEIVKQLDGSDRYLVNVPDLPRNYFHTQVEAEKFIRDNTDFAATTKYHGYQLPGGENYREMLLTLPHTPRDMVRPSEAASAKYLAEWNDLVKQQNEVRPLVDDYNRRLSGPEWEQAKADLQTINKRMNELHDKMVDDTIAESNKLGKDPFKSSHWDEPNVLAHIRMNDRTIPVEFTPEQKKLLEQHAELQTEINKIRDKQTDIAIEIRNVAKPIEKARKDKILADAKAGRISNVEAMKQMEDYELPKEIIPLQEKLAELRAEEDKLRASLPEKPVQKSNKTLHIEEIQSDFGQLHRKESLKIKEAINNDFDSIADRMVKAGVIKKICD